MHQAKVWSWLLSCQFNLNPTSITHQSVELPDVEFKMPCNNNQFTEADIPDLSGYVVIVTGGTSFDIKVQCSLFPYQMANNRFTGNSGIGYQTSLQLALRHARVYVGGRSEERVNKAIEQMKMVAGTVELDLRFLQIDLQNLRLVKAAATLFKEKESRLDILINNAGVGSCITMIELESWLTYDFSLYRSWACLSNSQPMATSCSGRSTTWHRTCSRRSFCH